MTNFATSSRRLSTRIAVFASVLLPAAGAWGIEPASEFLKGLKEQGYYDTAIEYLDMAKDNPLVSPAFKDIIPYEKGLTLILSSRVTRDTKAREAQLDEAGKLLEDFVKAQSTHPYAALAKSQRANLLVERGKIAIERSKGQNVAEDQKQKLTAEARDHYSAAIGIFQTTLEDLKKLLQAFGTLDPKNPSHTKLIEYRDQYRTDFLQARLLIPAIKEELADTYPEGNAERKKLLTEAAKEFKDAHEDYRTRIAGLYAQLYEGRCHAKLKNEKEALYCFNELLNQPDGPEFRGLKLKTLVEAAPVWLGSEPPKVDEAITQINKLLVTANRDESKEPEWLFLRLAFAKANKLKADELQEQVPRTQALRDAKTAALFVARYNSEYRDEARELLTGMGEVDIQDEETGPLNFAEARTKGKEALDDMNTAVATYSKLAQEYAATTDDARKKELAEDIKAVQQESQDLALKAYDLLRTALTMADTETPDEDLNVVRYLLCYLYYYLGDYYEAASMGEFIALRYPASSAAKQCAQIAMASYVKARKEAIEWAEAESKETNEKVTPEIKFESDKITELCRFITQQWPNQPEAVEAAQTLIIFSLQDKNFDQAAEYLNVIPENTPHRGFAERLIGQHIWTVYLTTINQLERAGASDEIIDAKKQEMADEISDAAALMEKGLGRVGSETITQPVAAAALSLAQIYVDRGETARALALLEDKKFGPLSLVKRKEPAAMEKSAYEIETYKTALRAYIAALSAPDAAQRENAKTAAKDIIGRLKTAMGSEADGRERLVTTFMVMANKLKSQMDGLTDLNEKKAFADGLASFLTELSNESRELNIRTWVADTFSKLGETLSADPSTANAYYKKSVEAFEEILKDPALPESTELQIQMRLGDTKLLLKDFEGALEEYVKVLTENNVMLNVQVKAANAFQQWGDATVSSPKTAREKYVKAMVGDFPDERDKIDGEKNKNHQRNIVWGWGKLFQITMRYEQFRNTFFEARYNLALCRFRLAELDDSDKYRKMAKNDILSTMKVASDLGGPNWRPKFNGLMIRIQESLGEKPKGLPAPAS